MKFGMYIAMIKGEGIRMGVVNKQFPLYSIDEPRAIGQDRRVQCGRQADIRICMYRSSPKDLCILRDEGEGE